MKRFHALAQAGLDGNNQANLKASSEAVFTEVQTIGAYATDIFPMLKWNLRRTHRFSGHGTRVVQSVLSTTKLTADDPGHWRPADLAD
mmetsp:Transcript_11565/g.23512  ORF Transcript_11565/g.23512 Transcript_11565/m.23512 type:complete len:88 (+) Transcript_11565:1742-2005(+)